MAFRSPKKNFDKSLIEDALRLTPAKRFRESCELYEFYAKVTPYITKPFAKSFSSFAEYEKWKKTQKNPGL